MQTIAVRSTVTKANGFYWMEAYESRKVPPSVIPALTKQFEDFRKMAELADGPNGEYTGILSVTIDGVAQPDIVSHMSKTEFHKIQKITKQWGSDMMALMHK